MLRPKTSIRSAGSAGTSRARARRRLERARLLEQVGRAGHDDQFLLAAQQCAASAVHPDHRHVVAAHDQQRRRPHLRQCIAREVGPSAARYDGADRVRSLGGGHQRRGRTGARAEQADGEPGDACLRRSQSVAPTSRSASRSMSKRSWRVRSSTASSSGVSRSTSSVASPAWFSVRATWRLRGLRRLLPLPWANSTRPAASAGRARSASSRTCRRECAAASRQWQMTDRHSSLHPCG